MNFITLENPLNIYEETSIQKENYIVVFNFTSGPKTKIFYNGEQISEKQALDLIRYEGIECRLYNNNVEKISSRFSEKYEEFFVCFSVFATFATMALIFSKKEKN